MNKQINNKVQHEKQISNKKNKGKKVNGNIRPFSYTSFNNYGTSNKKKRKRNWNIYTQCIVVLINLITNIKWIYITLSFIFSKTLDC